MHVIAGQGRRVQAAADDQFREDQRRTIEQCRGPCRDARRDGAKVVSGGTDNHLMLVDVTPLGVTGKEAEHLLDEVGITVNKNAIPFDPLPPNTPRVSGWARPPRRRAASVRPRCARRPRIIIEAIQRRDDETSSGGCGRGGRDRLAVPRPCPPREQGIRVPRDRVSWRADGVARMTVARP